MLSHLLTPTTDNNSLPLVTLALIMGMICFILVGIFIWDKVDGYGNKGRRCVREAERGLVVEEERKVEDVGRFKLGERTDVGYGTVEGRGGDSEC